MRRPWRLVAWSSFVSSVLFGALVGDRLLAVTDEVRDKLAAYSELLEVAHQRYGEQVTYRDLVYSSISGMMRSLDPHTNFLPPEALSSMRERQQTSFYGLGILVGTRNGRLTVISPMEGGPASRVGLRAGDVIDTIEGESTEEMNQEEAVQKLKGPKGTQVSITVLRRGLEQPMPFTITRDEIPQTTVRQAYLLDAETGYILISDFARGTGDEVAQAIQKLRDQGMRRLVLDLRNNGGGLLDQAISVAGQFVPKGEAIVETRGRGRDTVQRYESRGEHPPLGLPLVVVVNHGTASASEIVSGAVQDHDLGVVVGQPTWGKGLVQTVYNLPYGAGLALTTAKYFTPAGRLIQRDFTSFFDYAYVDESATPQVDTASPGPDPERPTESFRTDLGRTVFGGGGITPDVRVAAAETPVFVQFLFARNAFFDFAVDWTRRHGKPSPDWTPPADLLAGFEAWLQGEELGSAAENASAFADPATRDATVRQLHIEIFNVGLGLEAGHRVGTRTDPQILSAIGQFDRAAQLLASRAVLAERPPSGASATPR